ncbi:hypothetical protein [Ancylobacter sp. TS-1]|uniref:hypothetical protein n=1 Tax=Ancylobacter sp. TS-1 TaxID=1850374 RepID=UPI001265B2D4|nr:hypothetical protein [Ancylobacter sp. TS-1]QFR33245.1 hypothetical protein GBB76_08915 [Ancylobacter sp. TS-1]
MADYFPLIARAIGGLPEKTGEARKAVYERARRALLAQLRAVDPPLAEPDVQRERQSLEDAIIRVEAEFAAPLPSQMATPPAPPPAAPVPPRAPEAPRTPEPASRTGEFAPTESEAVAAGLDPAQVAAGAHDWRSDAARLVRARETAATYEEETASEGSDAEAEETLAADAPARPAGGRGKLVGLLVFAVLLIAAAAVGYTQRQTIVALIGGASSSTQAPQTAQAPARPVKTDAPKSTDRIAQAPDTSRPAQSAPSNAGNAQPDGSISVAQRAVLFEESPGGGEQGLQQYVGTVVWSTETTSGGNGQAPDVGIRADISIPARDIAVTLTLRRNQDASVPASHIIEVQFKLPPNFDLGNVSSVPGMRAKASEGAQGAPLVGLAVRVAPSYFLIGLSSLDSDVQRNLSFLITRNWLDLPIVFENGRRAILVLDKGEAGDQVFRQAFTAWGLQPPPKPSAN